MPNKINFITGETYTISELFSGERQVVIPDLQRDYCWGDETNRKASGEVGELVSDFIGGLMELYDNRKDRDKLNLGLFYGYEIPADHIQLCDGQQRLTTLYLLLGMLNKSTGKFNQYLISGSGYKYAYEEPYLKYAIRESSLYFISDLVSNFFQKDNNCSVDSIKKEDWYFSDYDLDSSVGSMINALKKIESLIAGKDGDWLMSFGDWILNKLTFLYFDMENRKNGEETFVVINTTGEPLSATQNLKPLVINAEINKKYGNVAEDWEKIETWFWTKRQGNNDTADAGFAEFLRWVSIIEQVDEELPNAGQSDKYLIQGLLRGEGKCDFPYSKIEFSAIYEYWQAAKWLFDNAEGLELERLRKEILSPSVNKNVNGRKAIGQIDCFVLLPLLKFVRNYQNQIETQRRNVKRLYEFFNNLAHVGNVQKSVNTLVRDAIKIADSLTGGDIVSLASCDTGFSSLILSKEEIRKLEILRSVANREAVEERFWKVQRCRDFNLWSGEILPVIEWATDNGNFDFNGFCRYSDLLETIFSGEVEHEEIIDLMRRGLIVCQNNYEPIRRGKYYSFGWEWGDWRELLSRDCEGTRNLFDYLRNDRIRIADSDYIAKALAEYIRNGDKKKDYYEFAESNDFLEFTHKSECCDMDWSKEDWQICTTGGRGRHTKFISRRNIYIFKSLKEEILSGSWNIWAYRSGYKDNCVVVENNRLKIKIDIRYFSDSKLCEMILKPSYGYETDAVAEKIRTIARTESDFEMLEDSIWRTTLDGAFDVEKIKQRILEIVGKIDALESLPA